MREFTWHKNLRESLPGVSAPYHHTHLTDEEWQAFELTLRDGFGDVEEQDAWSGPLPDGVDTGLLAHKFYLAPRHKEDLLTYADEYRDEVFWRESDGDDPPGPFELFPLRFDLTSLGIYFHNQRLRFIENDKQRHLTQPQLPLSKPSPSEEAPSDDFEMPHWFYGETAEERLLVDESIWEMAKYSLYSKPWYEYHALHLIALVELCNEVVVRKGRDGTERRYEMIGGHLALNWIGQLGRLVEQYNWRFRFEHAAKSGLAALKGASAGGRARSNQSRRGREAWQEAAQAIWGRRPSLSKIAVADLVRRQQKLPFTAKHIARFISLG